MEKSFGVSSGVIKNTCFVGVGKKWLGCIGICVRDRGLERSRGDVRESVKGNREFVKRKKFG